MLFDLLDNALGYPFGPAWVSTVDALRALMARSELPVGEYPLADGARAIVMEYATRPRAEGLYEAHDVMADIQLVLEGEEYIDIAPRAALTPSAPYDAAKDIVFYKETPEAAARVLLRPGSFALLPPRDAHMPSLNVRGACAVKKLVIKLPVRLLPGA